MTTVTNELSIYQGQLTEVELVNQVSKIKKMFPKYTTDFLLILKDRFADNNFNDERMIASVNHVIDNFQGWNRVPNVADFIQYDKTVPIYTYQGLLKEAIDFPPPQRKEYLERHTQINVGLDTPRWCLKEYIQKYKLTKWSK